MPTSTFLSHTTGQNSNSTPTALCPTNLITECVHTKYLDSPQPTHQQNRTKMGPNTRIEAIRDIESDILDSLKRLGRFTTDTTSKKLQSMTYENFTKKHASLPHFKRLCEQTIRATRDGQQLAPRIGANGFYYRLFENFADILQEQHNQILDIQESMDNLRDLYEYRKQHSKQQTYTFKPVKERPPTPYTANVDDIFRTIDLTLSRSSSKSKTPPPPPASPSGYSSSSSSSSESTNTTTTATITTTVRHKWSDSDDSSTCSSQSNRCY